MGGTPVEAMNPGYDLGGSDSQTINAKWHVRITQCLHVTL